MLFVAPKLANAPPATIEYKTIIKGDAFRRTEAGKRATSNY